MIIRSYTALEAGKLSPSPGHALSHCCVAVKSGTLRAGAPDIWYDAGRKRIYVTGTETATVIEQREADHYVVERHTEVTGDDGDWRDLWLRYGIAWHPEAANPPAVDDQEIDDALSDEIDTWVGAVVDAFCTRMGVRQMFVEPSNEEARR